MALIAKNSDIVNGVNGAAKVDSGEVVGRVRMLFDEITFSGLSVLNAVTKVCAKLPAGARVIDATIVGADVTLGSYTLGHAASKNHVANASAFATGVFTTANIAKPTVANTGIGKKFEDELQLELKCTAVSAASDGKKLQLWINYVLD